MAAKLRKSTAMVLRVSLILAISVLGIGLVLLALRVPMIYWAIALMIAMKQRKRIANSLWSHGSAVTATLADLIRHNLLNQDGLI